MLYWVSVLIHSCIDSYIIFEFQVARRIPRIISSLPSRSISRLLSATLSWQVVAWFRRHTEFITAQIWKLIAVCGPYPGINRIRGDLTSHAFVIRA